MTMKMVLRSLIVAVTGLSFMLAGCSEVPITGRRQLSLVPTSVVASMSTQQYTQFISENKVSSDPQKVAMVKRVGQNIVQAVDEYCKTHCDKNPFAGYQWEINLIEDPQVNAFAMPGGKVVVYTGILPVAQNEAGLATVMGHEIAHVFAGHGEERMSQGLLVQMGGIALSTALQKQPEQTQNLFMSAYGLGSQVGVLLPYSRLHESEADHLGLIFMAMAGYDPHEAVGFWERMAAQAGKGQAKPPEFLSTHPADATRIKKLQELVPEAMEYYKPPTGAGQGRAPVAPSADAASQPLAFPPIKK
jgi:predicted Zn-dependent protease